MNDGEIVTNQIRDRRALVVCEDFGVTWYGRRSDYDVTYIRDDDEDTEYCLWPRQFWPAVYDRPESSLYRLPPS